MATKKKVAKRAPRDHNRDRSQRHQVRDRRRKTRCILVVQARTKANMLVAVRVAQAMAGHAADTSNNLNSIYAHPQLIFIV